MKELRRSRGIHVNPWQHFPRLITSIDFLKRDRPLRLFREVLPAEGEPLYPRRFDLLIVDEAHNVAPSAGGKYAIDSQRTAAIRLLVPHFEHKLFLTATPHNGYPESFTALLELLDTQRFARGVTPDRNQLQVVMVRRLKQELQNWDGSPRFPVRKLEAIAVDYPEAERRAHRALKRYTELRCRGVADNTEKYATEFVLKLLKKRLFSSTEAFRSTLEQHEKSLTSARRRTNSSLSRPSEGILRRQVEQVDEEYADDAAYEEATEEAIANTSFLFRPVSAEEQSLLQEMRQWAETASRQADAKATELLNWIHTYIRPKGQWSIERVIIFTEYRATQKWLYNLLAAEGLAQDERLLTLYGGMNSDDRERVKAAFQARPDVSPVRILLATDAASEGLDLQNHCYRLIHYEIPWNPNRMEQRNGRIDRHGQKAKEVLIYHFVGKDYKQNASTAVKPGELEGDLEFLMRAALKVNNIREDLGKVGSVIATQVEEAMLGRRTTLDTTASERESEPVRRMLKFERKVREQIEKLREQLNETRQNLRLTPDNIESVVKIGLELAEQPPLIEAAVKGLNGKAFHLPALKSSWAACNEGLADPHTKITRPIVFAPELAHGRDDVVLAHLNHRLVQMCLRLLRSEVWSTDGRKNLNRVTARLVSSSSGLDYPAVVVYGRLVILGSDQQRLHEEVITAGGLLKDGKFSRLGVMQLMAAIGAALLRPPINRTEYWQKYYTEHLGKPGINFWEWKRNPEAWEICPELTALLQLPRPDEDALAVLKVLAHSNEPFNNLLTNNHDIFEEFPAPRKHLFKQAFHRWHQCAFAQVGADQLAAIYKVCFGCEWERELISPHLMPSVPDGEWWEVLGVDKNATDKEIKTAYRVLAKQWHPDTTGSPQTLETMQRITTAYGKARSR